MDAYDASKARRVWQRVQAAQLPTAPQMEADGLIISAQTAKGVYLRLARQGLAGEAAALKKLAEMKQSQIDCLNGMRLLSAGGKHSHPPLPIPKESFLVALRRCHSIEVRTLREYELRTTQRDHGPIWSDLAGEQRNVCRILLELMGRLDK